MSYVPKAFYGFLVFVMLASFLQTWAMLDKSDQHKNTFWPRHFEQNNYRENSSWFESLTENSIRIFDSIFGKIICLVLIAAMTYGCGKLAFQYEYLYPGLFILSVFTAFCAWLAIALRFIPIWF